MRILNLLKRIKANELPPTPARIAPGVRYVPRAYRAMDAGTWKRAIEAYEGRVSRAVELQSMYSQLLRIDGHLYGEYLKRRLAVTTCIPRAEIDGIEYKLERLAPIAIWQELAGVVFDAICYGWSLIDFAPGSIRWDLLPRGYYVAHKRKMTTDGVSGEIGLDNTTASVVDTGTPGIFAITSWWSIIKRNCVSDYAQYAELYGMPIQDIVYKGNDPVVKQKIKELLENQAGNQANVWPDDVEINQRQGANAAANAVYDGLVDVCNREISKAIVGQTMTTESGSSYAQAKIHHDIYQAVAASDRVWVEMKIMTEVVPVMHRVYGVPENLIIRLYEDEAIDRGALVDQDLRVVQLYEACRAAGLSTKWIEERYGIKIENNEN